MTLVIVLVIIGMGAILALVSTLYLISEVERERECDRRIRERFRQGGWGP